MLTPLLQAARTRQRRLAVHDVLPPRGWHRALRSRRRANDIKGARNIIPTQSCYHLVVHICRATATQALHDDQAVASLSTAPAASSRPLAWPSP